MVVIVALFLLFMIRGLNNRLKLTRYSFVSSKVNTEIRVIFISDLHSCQYGKNQNILLGHILAFQPDLILLGGDILDKKMPETAGFHLVRAAVKIAPTYFVTGNHEFYTAQCERIKKQMTKIGVHILDGKKESLVLCTNPINVIGIDDPLVGKKTYTQQLQQLKRMKNQEFTFFLTHHPERVDDYQQVRSDLVLAGHAHGGQWRIPGLVNGLFAPHQGLFPKYTAGFYHLSNTTLLVGRGLNRESIKVPRFYNPPELIVLKIVPISKEMNKS